jgi:hypothetical protein
MISALNSALSGLHSASQKFERSANDIVRSGAPASAEGQTKADESDLVGGLTSIKEAETQFAASAKVFGAIARSEERLLDILA